MAACGEKHWVATKSSGGTQMELLTFSALALRQSSKRQLSPHGVSTPWSTVSWQPSGKNTARALKSSRVGNVNAVRKTTANERTMNRWNKARTLRTRLHPFTAPRICPIRRNQSLQNVNFCPFLSTPDRGNPCCVLCTQTARIVIDNKPESLAQFKSAVVLALRQKGKLPHPRLSCLGT